MPHLNSRPPAAEFEDCEIELPDSGRRGLCWAVSAVLHLFLLFLLASWIDTQAPVGTSEKTLVSHAVKRKPYEPEKTRARPPQPRIRKDPLQKGPSSQAKPEIMAPAKPNGTDLKTTCIKELGCRSMSEALDPARPAVGFFSCLQRSSASSFTREGGSEATEDAVLAALWWLQRHQHPDGYWSSSTVFTGNCQDPSVYDDDIKGIKGYDVGVTSLALLTFLGYAHTHQKGEIDEFVVAVRKGMKWLLKQQTRGGEPEERGTIGKNEEESWVYNHAIATVALAELLVLSKDQFKLRKPVELATRYIFAAQNDEFGWRYEFQGGKSDTSVTGWMVLALKAARSCHDLNLIRGFEPQDHEGSLEKSLAWFDHVTSKTTGSCGYQHPGDKGSLLLEAYDPDSYPFSKKLSCMTAVSVLCRLLASQRSSDQRRVKAVQSGIEVLMQELPHWHASQGQRNSTINHYYWYFGSYALFQFGGRHWREWNKAMIAALVPTQRQGSDADGSWDPLGEWGAAGGRSYSTAIGAMTLQVYYRFERVFRAWKRR